MIDYVSIIDKRIDELKQENNNAIRHIQSMIEDAMAEFVFIEACKAKDMPETVNSETEFAEVEAKRHSDLISANLQKIEALEEYKERLDEEEIKQLLAEELQRLSRLTFPED